MPGDLPPNLHLRCVDHPEFESTTWTYAYYHIRDVHNLVTPHWLFLADNITTE
jgi:hypothetical protein